MLWASQNVAGDFPPILLKIFLHELYHVHEVKLCTSLFSLHVVFRKNIPRYGICCKNGVHQELALAYPV